MCKSLRASIPPPPPPPQPPPPPPLPNPTTPSLYKSVRDTEQLFHDHVSSLLVSLSKFVSPGYKSLTDTEQIFHHPVSAQRVGKCMSPCVRDIRGNGAALCMGWWAACDWQQKPQHHLLPASQRCQPSHSGSRCLLSVAVLWGTFPFSTCKLTTSVSSSVLVCLWQKP